MSMPPFARSLGAALLLCLLLGSCSGPQRTFAVPAEPFAAQLAGAAGAAPAGVDPALWNKLTAELERVVVQAGTAKRSSAAAIGKGSIVPDLSLHVEAGQTHYTWSYRQQGDYDLNGSVTIGDLTPIGLHFGKNTLSADWQQAQLADGDGNGEVNISDVTPIGANFGGRVDGYELQRRPDSVSPFTLMAEYAFVAGNAQTGLYPQYTHLGLFVLVGPDFRVVPYVEGGGPRQYGIESTIYHTTAGLETHWYTARGNVHRDGRVLAAGPSSDASTWTLDLDAGSIFTPYAEIIADQSGTIYFGTASETTLDAAVPGGFHAISPEGKFKWSFVTQGGVAMAASACLVGRIVFGDISGMVYCLAPDGKQLWRRQISGMLVFGSPLVDNLGNVFIISHTWSGSSISSSTLYKLSPEGAVDWSRALNDKCESAPFFNSLGHVTIVDSAGELYSFDYGGASTFNFIMPDAPAGSSFNCGICSRDTSLIYSTATDGFRLNTETNTISVLVDLVGERPVTMPVMNSLNRVILASSTTGVDPVYRLNYYDGAVEEWDIDIPGDFVSNIAVDGSDRMYFATYLQQDGGPTFGNGISCVLPDQTTAWFHPTGTTLIFSVSLVSENLLVGLAVSAMGGGGTLQLIGIKGP